jgi:hypothetical protein
VMLYLPSPPLRSTRRTTFLGIEREYLLGWWAGIALGLDLGNQAAQPKT